MVTAETCYTITQCVNTPFPCFVRGWVGSLFSLAFPRQQWEQCDSDQTKCYFKCITADCCCYWLVEAQSAWICLCLSLLQCYLLSTRCWLCPMSFERTCTACSRGRLKPDMTVSKILTYIICLRWSLWSGLSLLLRSTPTAGLSTWSRLVTLLYRGKRDPVVKIKDYVMTFGDIVFQLCKASWCATSPYLILIHNCH